MAVLIHKVILVSELDGLQLKQARFIAAVSILAA